jgi:polysaccharide export outer membrane protein
MSSSSNDMPSPTSAGKTPSAFSRGAVLLILAVSLLVVAGCGSVSNSIELDSDLNLPTASLGNGIYSTNELHEGDVVNITFQYSTNFNTVQKIALDGRLNLDMVGPVKAAGKTLTELQQDLGQAYKVVAKDDVITVKLISSTASIYVNGAVLRPGTVEMDRPLTVIEAVMEAGGFDSTRAKLSDVKVLRVENGREQIYHINLKKVLEGKDQSPFYLQPFDIIYVPAKIFNY